MTIGGWQWGRGMMWEGDGNGGCGREQRRGGWVPTPRLHGGRISTRGQGGGGQQDSSTPLRCARNGMCEVGNEDGDGFPPPREQRTEGGAGMREGDGFPPSVFTGAGSRREDKEGGGRFPNRPYGGESDRRGVGRWVPAAVGTTEGGMGWRMYEENGRLHPHPNLPP